MTFVENNIENNEKSPKFEIGDHVRISKYKNIFAKGYAPNWSEKIYVIKNVKNTVQLKYVISNLTAKEIVRMFYK